MKALPTTIAAALALLAGCSSVNYAQNGAVAPRAPREPSLIVIHMHGDPAPKGFQVAGTLHASAGNAARSLELLREEAAKNGLDGIAEVNCAPAGARDEGSCDGQGFVYQ
jgi:hypothetical protein